MVTVVIAMMIIKYKIIIIKYIESVTFSVSCVWFTIYS